MVYPRCALAASSQVDSAAITAEVAALLIAEHHALAAECAARVRGCD